MPENKLIKICNINELQEGGLCVPFDLEYKGNNMRAFAIKYEGKYHAYLNQCTHVAIELDFVPNQIFDDTGQWLLCSSHGAVYSPDEGKCAGGPCTGGLIKINLEVKDDYLYWLEDENTKEIKF